jgi:histidinol-phosphate aminotransferase
MINIHKLIRKNIEDMKPYSSARDEYTGNSGIFLDANENSIGSAAEKPLNRYPDPRHRKLRGRLAELKGVQVDNLFLGNGSDEAIDLVIRAFCEPKQDRIIVTPPTYGMYEVCAAVNDVEVTKVPLTTNFEIDIASMMRAVNPETKLIFLCSPNNPTANCFAEEHIEKILEKFQGLLILDEAYADFASDKSWLPRLNRYENLLILQTFSKAWGLANIRLGIAFASPEIIKILDKIKYPYNVNGVTQEIALQVLGSVHRKNKMVNEIIQQREILRNELIKLTVVEKVYPSDTNFLLVKVSSARSIYRYLMDYQIIVRDRSNALHCENCLRITIGTPEENVKLIEALKNYKAK